MNKKKGMAKSINQSINQSTLFNEGDTQQSSTDKPVALEFSMELEFRNGGFYVAEKFKASVKDHEPPLPIIPFRHCRVRLCWTTFLETAAHSKLCLIRTLLKY